MPYDLEDGKMHPYGDHKKKKSNKKSINEIIQDTLHH